MKVDFMVQEGCESDIILYRVKLKNNKNETFK